MIYVRRNTKKYYQLPGVIALALFLPILFVYYLFQIGFFNVQYCTPVVFEDKDCNAPWCKYDTSGKKYTEFVITGDKESDTKSLILARKEIRKLIDSKDTLRGIHFYFTKTSKYNEFIELVSICEEEHTDIYIPRGNDFWVVNFGSPKRYVPKIQPVFL